jgi:hypothetical protein
MALGGRMDTVPSPPAVQREIGHGLYRQTRQRIMFGIETPIGRTPFRACRLMSLHTGLKAPDFAKPTSRQAF